MQTNLSNQFTVSLGVYTNTKIIQDFVIMQFCRIIKYQASVTEN